MRTRTMVASWALVAGLAAGGGAMAQARPDSLSMTCAQVRALVVSRGAIVIGSGKYIYDRFVSDRRFCAPLTEGVRPAWVPARDTPQCPLGFTCVPLHDTWPFSDF